MLLTDTPEAAAIATIGDGLDAFDTEVTGIVDRRPLAVLLRDPHSGKVIGGLGGRTSMGLMFIDLFHLPLEYRGDRRGSRMLQMAEEEARRRGCCAGVLYTISFQAPDFYRRHGWEVFGEVPCQPMGTARLFVRKRYSRNAVPDFSHGQLDG